MLTSSSSVGARICVYVCVCVCVCIFMKVKSESEVAQSCPTLRHSVSRAMIEPPLESVKQKEAASLY